MRARVALEIFEAFEAQLPFAPSLVPLVPQRFARPGIPAQHTAVFKSRPGMMSNRAVDAEKLHLSQFAAQPVQETETGVHVLARIGQKRSDDQHPAIDRGETNSF